MARKKIESDVPHYISEKGLVTLMKRVAASGNLLKLSVHDNRGGNGDFLVVVETVDGSPLD